MDVECVPVRTLWPEAPRLPSVGNPTGILHLVSSVQRNFSRAERFSLAQAVTNSSTFARDVVKLFIHHCVPACDVEGGRVSAHKR